MKLTFTAMVFAIATFLAWSGMAATLDSRLIQTSGNPSVAAGMFYGYQTKSDGPGDESLEKAKALATAEHVPLVVIWSEEDCQHCNNLISEINGKVEEVASFLSTNRAVFVYFKADTSDNKAPASNYKPEVVYDAYDFITRVCGGQAAFPLFGFYYEKGDGSIVTGGSPSGTGSRSWAGFKSLYLKWLSDNDIEPNYRGGSFAASGTEFDRYEAERTTEYVDIELVRGTDSLSSVCTNRLVAVFPSGDVLTNEVPWALEETAKSVRIGLKNSFVNGEKVGLELYGDGGYFCGTNAIYFVEKANSNNNPLWLGERTAETLAFGEWTVDLDIVTNMVAATDGAAYTLVSVQGSLWCPDCANTDANFLDLADTNGDNLFRKWAESNHVALAVVDIPNFSARNGAGPENCASPSMFSKTAYLSRGAMRSGRPYLSRKMVSDEAAAAMRARNHFLVKTNTDAGGYHRPEDTNVYRTGVPIFVLLRKDGTVAARLTRFANKSPGEDDQANWSNYIARFDEMLELADEPGEISDNHPITTGSMLASDFSIASTLCHADTADWYELSDVSAGSSLRLYVSGEASNVITLALSVLEAGILRPVVKERVVLSDGFTLKTNLPPGERWFAGVSCQNTDDGFAVDFSGSTETRYTLALAASPPDQNPGEIAFASSDMRVIEFAGTGTVSIVRKDGGYGASSVRVICTKSDNASEERFVWEDQILSWRDGEQGEKEVCFTLIPNEVFEGDGTFTLTLERLQGNSFIGENATCAVTIIDTDAPCFGQMTYDVSAYTMFTPTNSFALIGLVSADTQVVVSRIPGSAPLPSGLTLKYDKKSGAILLSGVPKKTGTYEFTCVVSSRRYGKKVTGFETTFRFTITDSSKINPKLGVKRSNQIMTLFATDDEGYRLAAGTLSFASTSQGSLSAKYIGTEGRTVSFAGKWQTLDTNGTATATLVSKDCVLYASMETSGRLSTVLSLPDGYNCHGNTFSAEADWPETGVFDKLKGYYTVALPVIEVEGPAEAPTGSGFLTLSIAGVSNLKNGVVRFAGIAPDGISISGSTRISGFDRDRENAQVPFFSRSAHNIFGGVFSIGVDGAEKWASSEITSDGSRLVREIVTSASSHIAYTLHQGTTVRWFAIHSVYGSWYPQGVSQETLDKLFYSDIDRYVPEAPFSLSAIVEGATASERYGAFAPPSRLLVRVEPKGLALDKAQGNSFYFHTRNGVFRGAYRIPFDGGRVISAAYAGVVTPGWVLPCECGIVAPEKAYGCGTVYFTDSIEGRAGTRSIPLILDK